VSIYKTKIAAETYIKPLGTTTLTAGPDTLRTINLQTFGQIHSAAIIISDAVLAGNTTVIWYGSTATSGGTLTEIAKITMTSAMNEGVLQIDAEDIGEAAEAAGLSAGFKSIQCKIDGANLDTIRSCIVVNPMHKYHNLTPSDVTVLT